MLTLTSCSLPDLWFIVSTSTQTNAPVTELYTNNHFAAHNITVHKICQLYIRINHFAVSDFYSFWRIKSISGIPFWQQKPFGLIPFHLDTDRKSPNITINLMFHLTQQIIKLNCQMVGKLLHWIYHIWLFAKQPGQQYAIIIIYNAYYALSPRFSFLYEHRELYIIYALVYHVKYTEITTV